MIKREVRMACLAAYDQKLVGRHFRDEAWRRVGVYDCRLFQCRIMREMKSSGRRLFAWLSGLS